MERAEKAELDEWPSPCRPLRWRGNGHGLPSSSSSSVLALFSGKLLARGELTRLVSYAFGFSFRVCVYVELGIIRGVDARSRGFRRSQLYSCSTRPTDCLLLLFWLSSSIPFTLMVLFFRCPSSASAFRGYSYSRNCL